MTRQWHKPKVIGVSALTFACQLIAKGTGQLIYPAPFASAGPAKWFLFFSQPHPYTF